MIEQTTDSGSLRPPMTEEEKAGYRARLKDRLFRELRGVFRRRKERGLTQKEIARRLGIDEALVSKRLRGEANLTLDTLCDLARAMDARIDVKVTPLDAVAMAATTTTTAVTEASQYVQVALLGSIRGAAGANLSRLMQVPAGAGAGPAFDEDVGTWSGPEAVTVRQLSDSAVSSRIDIGTWMSSGGKKTAPLDRRA